MTNGVLRKSPTALTTTINSTVKNAWPLAGHQDSSAARR